MGKLTTAKGLITIVTIPESMQYVLRPSVSQIIIDFNGRPNVNIVTCKAYKAYGSGTEEEIKSSEGTIKYNTSANSELTAYTTNGVTVDVNWSFITFYLFINDEPKARVDVPITRNGQVDTNFRVWVGTVADPNSLSDRPWAGVENEDQSDFMHLKDYYVSPDMTYYCFVDDNGVYRWKEVTDINLKRWLARANNSTTGFIIPTSDYTSVAGYFSSREYRIGDLWTNATYPMADDSNYRKDGVTYTKDKPLYNDEPLICKKSKTGSFTIEDWQPISSIKDKLKETGIDLDEYRIVMAADEHWYYNNNGKRVALLNLVDGYPILNTNLLRIDGNVEIDGRVIVGAISENEDASNELSTLLQQQGFNPSEVNFSRDDDGNVVAKIGDNTYTWAEKKTDEVVQYTVKANDGEEHSFSLGTNGLLEAKNAVIQGKIYASEGAFTGELSSANGAFNVDGFGNVTCESINGVGVLRAGTTVITKENFYQYFMRSQIDIGQSYDQNWFNDLSAADKNKKMWWIPNFKELLENIIIESLPDECILTTQGSYITDITRFSILMLPHIWYYNTEKSIRRGGLTQSEFYLLDKHKYLFKNDSDVAFIAYKVSPNSSGYGDPNYFILLPGETTIIKYERSDNGFSARCVKIDDGDSDWQDCNPNSSITSSQPEIKNDDYKSCTIYLHYLRQEGDENITKFWFRWECSNAILLSTLGKLNFLLSMSASTGNEYNTTTYTEEGYFYSTNTNASTSGECYVSVNVPASKKYSFNGTATTNVNGVDYHIVGR